MLPPFAVSSNHLLSIDNSWPTTFRYALSLALCCCPRASVLVFRHLETNVNGLYLRVVVTLVLVSRFRL